MGDVLVTRSAKLVSMLSSEWQAKPNPEDASKNPDDSLFRWDGELVENASASGPRKLIGRVNEILEFDPAKRMNARGAPFSAITLGEDGKTNDPTLVRSGDVLMDLNRYQALRMEVAQIDGKDY